MSIEPDTFPDEQANVLTVVTKINSLKAVPRAAASRTFSNGSIDSRSVLSEMDKSETHTPLKPNGDARVNGDRSPALSRHTSPTKGPSSEASPAVDMPILWVKDQEVAIEKLPEGLGSEPYVQLRLKALDQRRHAATGTCPYDLDVLYQFWCHFLIRNFNNQMYSDFKFFATADATERHNTVGMQNLVKFYSECLSSNNNIIRDRVAKDYVELALNEPSTLDGLAFKKLRSAWRNGALNLKNRKKLADIIDPGLKDALDKVDP